MSHDRHPTVLHLPPALRAELEGLAVAGYPDEACGVLIGVPRDGHVEVRALRETRNLRADRPDDRYEVDPAALVRAEDAARAAGFEVVGIWHSHPDHPAEPSATDRTGAQPGWSYVIVSVRGGAAAEVRSFRLAPDDGFVEERVKA